MRATDRCNTIRPGTRGSGNPIKLARPRIDKPEARLPLVTADSEHFLRIPGLELRHWRP
jgi:hypothetical protein